MRWTSLRLGTIEQWWNDLHFFFGESEVPWRRECRRRGNFSTAPTPDRWGGGIQIIFYISKSTAPSQGGTFSRGGGEKSIVLRNSIFIRNPELCLFASLNLYNYQYSLIILKALHYQNQWIAFRYFVSGFPGADFLCRVAV